MKGKPKFKEGDKVVITLDGKYHVGEIFIVDPYGTWDDPSDVSYDVMIHDYRHPSNPDKITDCLCKHNTEKNVLKYDEKYFSFCPSTEPNDILPPAVIFDLDDTIMFRNNRSYYDYEGADNDTVDPKALWLIKRWNEDGVNIIFNTGREITDRSIEAIDKVLNVSRIHKLDGFYKPYEIYGRKVKDHRKGVVVKEENLKLFKDMWNILAAFDDDQDTVDMYKKYGIFSAKV